MPNVREEYQHQVRVAENLSQILLRECDMRTERVGLDTSALQDLLGDRKSGLEELEYELTRQLLRTQSIDFEDEAWLALSAITERSLAVNKPGYAQWRQT